MPTTTFLNMAAILDGIVIMFAVWSDGTVRDVRGHLLEGFDPLTTQVVSRNSVQSATLRRWPVGKANRIPWAEIQPIHARNGDHIHTLKEWMLGAEESKRTHFAGVIVAREDGVAEAQALWGQITEAYGLDDENRFSESEKAAIAELGLATAAASDAA